MSEATTPQADPQNAPDGTNPPAGDVLAELEAEARELEGGPARPGAAVVDPAAAAQAEAREVVELAGSILLPLLPARYGACYGKAERERIADTLGAVAAKRGWSVAGVMGGWGAELALAAALAGPALPVFLAERRERAEREAAPARNEATEHAAAEPKPAGRQVEQPGAADGRVL